MLINFLPIRINSSEEMRVCPLFPTSRIQRQTGSSVVLDTISGAIHEFFLHLGPVVQPLPPDGIACDEWEGWGECVGGEGCVVRRNGFLILHVMPPISRSSGLVVGKQTESLGH